MPLLALLLACASSEPPQPPPEILKAMEEAEEQTPGDTPPLVAVGDVRADRASFATRSSGYSRAWVVVGRQEEGAGWRSEDASLMQQHDFTASFTVGELPADTELHYTVFASTTAAPDPGQAIAKGRFRTAPPADQGRAVTLAVIGDLGGQEYCRPADGGYRILKSVEDVSPTLIVANGDLIYADGACPDLGPDGVAQLPGDFASISDTMMDWTDAKRVRENFHKHWRYNRSDPNFVSLLAAAPLIAQWDDHEVINDMGPWDTWLTGDAARPGYPQLYAAGREAFFAWNPIEVHPEEPTRVYRSFRWGQHMELFVVDARSYRSPNTDSDGPDKTLLGAAQLAWLTEAVTQSDATWKVVSVDVPMSIPTGYGAWRVGRDGWANGEGDPSTPDGATDISAQTGYERELGQLLGAFDAAGVQGLVFVTTDVHFAESIRYNVDLNGDGEPLVFHELVTGPLRAWMGEPPPLDPSFKPETLYAEGGGSFFSVLEVSEDGGSLKATVRGTDGAVREGSELVLTR